MAPGKDEFERLGRLARSAGLLGVVEGVRGRLLLTKLAQAEAARRDADTGLHSLEAERSRLTRLLLSTRPDGGEQWTARIEQIRQTRERRGEIIEAKTGLEKELRAHEKLLHQTFELFRHTGARRDAAEELSRGATGTLRAAVSGIRELSDEDLKSTEGL